MRRSVFIGRFQPVHDGHIAIIRKVLDEGKAVAVLLRHARRDNDNPWTAGERREMFRAAFPSEYGNTLFVHSLPFDVDEVCYGRGVGYGFREIRVDAETEAISATAIRGAT